MKAMNENILAMAPAKQIKPQVGSLATRVTQKPVQGLSVATRSRSINTMVAPIRSKRKADCSPAKQTNVKRTAMGDITNGKKNEDKLKKATVKQPIKKAIVQTKVLASVRTAVRPKAGENIAPPPAPCINVVTRAAVKNVVGNQTAVKPKDTLKENTHPSKIKTRLSNEFEKTEESLYSSALEDLNDSIHYSEARAKQTKSPKSEQSFSSGSNSPATVSFVARELETKLHFGNHEVPQGVEDFDKENWDDIYQVSHYAMDIFNYLKSKEHEFKVSDYMERQVCLNPWMRSLLVDWMVEVQESFELNHETLYLGVKLVDFYLSRMTVGKETLQLVGAAAMFVASKYDERIPPLIDDFLYICDGAYSRRELTRMEINLLKICNFNLGLPLSYRFLRRYARTAKIAMPVLTLARYVLEYSLMDYATVTVRDSILASAALYIALKMKKLGGWNQSLQFYSGYDVPDFIGAVYILNNCMHRKLKSPLTTVKNKYSHKIFFEVAKVPLLSNEALSMKQ